MVIDEAVEPLIDVHELILSADLVCGFYSSVILEAALAGKPVVIPLFDYFRYTDFGKRYPFDGYLDLFDIAVNK